MTLFGVLNLNKPAGFTSHDAVDAVRKITRIRRIGHTGTLDPMATGVLPLCVGNATKIAQFLIAQDKEYEVEMTLGLITDSQDTTGKLVEERDWRIVSDEDIRRLPEKFTGTQKQVPPMVSAKHHEGKRLYQLAREGIEVEREPIEIQITQLEILSMELPRIRFRVLSSKGTYIRTLCHDMGLYLGTGGTMSALVRTRCGAFHIKDSALLDDLKSPEDVLGHLHTVDNALSSIPAVEIAETARRRIFQGQPVLGSHVVGVIGKFEAGGLVRIKTSKDELLAMGKAEISSVHIERLGGGLNVVKPIRLLAEGR
ncbi:MAG TPA: tRNA pseudouridine(55) synthase TruB [bacterium]|nr:tRNA pseudouridine(55) synthase TruB [bacterium]